MKVKTLFATLTLGLAVAGTAGAWGLPAALNSFSSPSASADPGAFLEKAQKSEALIDKSADSLFKAIASKEELAKIEELQKKLNETTDDKEKNAIRQQITESEMATITKRSKDKQLQREAKNWDEKKKQQVSNSFYNFSLGSLQAAALVPEGNSIAKSISSNPANAARLGLKLNSVVQSVQSIGGILGNTTKVIGAMKPLMSAAKIDIKVPSSASEAPKDATDEV